MMALDPRMMRDAPSPRALAVALLVDFVIAATFFNVFVPAFEMPDEHTHFYMAQHVAQMGALPVQPADPHERGPWEQEGSQPPLYYLLAAPLLRLTGSRLGEDDLRYNHQNSMGFPEIRGNENRFLHLPEDEGWPWRGHILALRLGRLLSTLLGAVTVWAVWWIARRIFPGRRWLALAAMALVAFNPQFLAVSAAFSNDPAIIALSALALALLLRVADGHADERTIPLLAVVVGLAPLAKLSGLALAGFALLTLGFLAWRQRSWRQLIQTTLPVVLALLVLSGWWYARNLQLYGSFTGLDHMLPGHTGRSFRLDRWLQEEAWGELKGIWMSSWGIFGWFTILMPQAVYRWISILTGLSLLGLLLAGLRRADWLDWSRLGWLALWGAIVFTSLLRWLSISKGGQGRLLFPAIALLAIGLVAGWRALLAPLLERRGRKRAIAESLGPDADPEEVDLNAALQGDAGLAWIIMLGMYLFAFYALFGVIRPAFAQPRAIEPDALPAAAAPVDAVFGNGFRLAAIELPERVAAGERFPVTLYWQVEQPIERDGFVALRLDPMTEGSAVGDATVDAASDADEGRGENEPEPEDEDEGEERDLADPILGRPFLSYPGGGNAPPWMLYSGEQLYVDRRELVAPTTERVALRLSVQLYDVDAGAAWPIQGRAEGDTEWATTLIVGPARRADGVSGASRDAGVAMTGLAEVPPGPPLATFENGLRLYLEPGHQELVVPNGGRSLSLLTPLVWEAQQDRIDPVKVFVHLMAESGAQLATFDRDLRSTMGYPVSEWRSGEAYRVELPWTIESSLSAAGVAAEDERRGELVIGLYTPGDGSRIPAYDAGGTRFPADAIPLHRFER